MARRWTDPSWGRRIETLRHQAAGASAAVRSRVDNRERTGDFRGESWIGGRRSGDPTSVSRKLFTNLRNADPKDAAKLLKRWLAALDDFRNWLIREAA
jgi:hypothetical protein